MPIPFPDLENRIEELLHATKIGSVVWERTSPGFAWKCVFDDQKHSIHQFASAGGRGPVHTSCTLRSRGHESPLSLERWNQFIEAIEPQ